MIHSRPETSDSDDFRGFDEARRIMWSHEARARVFERLELTTFITDAGIAAVHVNDTTRADRVFLTAFDKQGCQAGCDILYTDEPGQHLDIACEFDHEFTGMAVPPGSELERAVTREDGWIVNMTTLRDYDLVADRRVTQRAVFLAHLQDMMNTGQAHGFLLGRDEPGSSDAA